MGACSKHELENIRELTPEEYELAMEEFNYTMALADIAYYAKVKGIETVFKDIFKTIERNK